MGFTKEQILAALSNVNDPDIKKDLVSLKMIDDVRIEGNKVQFKIVLTTPACPMKDQMKRECIEAIHKYVDKNATVEVELTSNVTSNRKVQEAIMPGVKNIIAVSSGKGGVGKSTIAANLAVSLGNAGAKVGLIDADIYGPSIPLMFDVVNQPPEIVYKLGKNMITPIEKFGIKLLSIGFFVEPEKALVWRGPIASNAMKQLFTDADWGDLDYVIVDLPPGTGDIHLTLVQSVPVTGAIIVSTPQQLAIADVKKAVDMFMIDSIKVPILGVVENMSYFVPAEYPDKKYYIFGEGGCKEFARDLGIPFLGEIPLVRSVSESGDNGSPIALNSDSPVSQSFKELSEKIAQQAAIGSIMRGTFNK